MDLATIRKNFEYVARNSQDFHTAAIAVAADMKTIAPNPDNWMLMFDLLHWDWTGFKDNENKFLFKQINPAELDKIAKAISPYQEQTEAIIKQQHQSAEEWAKALEACGISPEEGLGLARQELNFIVKQENHSTAIANSPSPISIPLEIVRLYREFYRTESRFKFGTTEALKPLLTAKEVIVKSSSTGLDLELEIAGKIAALMRQIHAKTAKGRWVIAEKSKEQIAISKFAGFITNHVLNEKFKGDKAKFSSKNGIGLIEDACLYIYTLEAEEE